LQRGYVFAVAIENEGIDGYVTEKLINPLLAGCIPIYWGAPDVSNYYNPRAFLNIRDFDSYEACIKYAYELSDEKLIEMMCEPIMTPIQYESHIIYKGGTKCQEIATAASQARINHCSPCMRTKYACTLATFGDGIKFKPDGLVSEAHRSGYFDAVHPFTLHSLQEDEAWWSNNKSFVENTDRGCGFLCWKAHLARRVMDKYDDGSIVTWCDAGNAIDMHRGMEVYETLYAPLLSGEVDFVVFRLVHLEVKWSKQDLINYVDIDPESTTPYQIGTNKFLLICNSRTRQFIREYERVSQQHHLIDLRKSVAPEHPTFTENRAEQSIFSLLLKRFLKANPGRVKFIATNSEETDGIFKKMRYSN
jgi:hypothetical protein